MSYQSGTAYQRQQYPTGDNYYYGDNRYPASDRNYHPQNGRGQNYQRGDATYNDYQRQEPPRSPQYPAQRSAEYNQQPREPTRDPPQHRYPATFQNVDQQPPSQQQSWDRGNPPQNRGNQLQDRNQPQEQYSNQWQQGPQSPTRPDNRMIDNARSQQGQRSYEDERNNDRYYGSNQQYPENRQSERGRGNYGHQDPPLNNNRYPNEQFQQRPEYGDSGGYRPQQYNRPTEQRDGMQRDDQAPFPPRNNQPYQQRQPERPNYAQGTFDQYEQPLEDRSQHDNRSQQSNVGRSEPPQVLAKSAGNTAIFGIVAKSDSSPTRRPPERTNQDYPSNQYPDQQHHQRDPRQRFSQSGQQTQPSPPTSPRSRGPPPPQQNWRTGNKVPQQREYGPPIAVNQNRSSERPDQHGQQYNLQRPDHQHGYNDPVTRDRPPPLSRGNDRGREDYTESSGYGSESTHNTDRSYDYQKQAPYNDRPGFRPNDQGYNNHDRPHPNVNPQDAPPRTDPVRSPPSQSYPNRYNDFNTHHQRGDDHSYGSRQEDPRYDPSPPDNRLGDRGNQDYRGGYGPQGYRDTGGHPQSPNYRDNHSAPLPPPPTNSNYGPRGYPDTQNRGPPPQHLNPESGVEKAHVKSVKDVKNMFERQTDPRRPPPGPKPITAPKPNVANVNARPVPPRPTNYSNTNWNRQNDNNDFPPPPPEVTAPRSPVYDDRRFDNRRQQQYQERPPAHSQSMDNLDNRVRYNRPPDNPNLGGTQQPDDSRYNQGSRSSYSGDPGSRPMVLGVKYTKDSSPPESYPNHDNQGSPVRRNRVSWAPDNARNNQYQQQPRSRSPPQPLSPTRRQDNRGNWGQEPVRDHQQSYNNNNWNNRQPQPHDYGQTQTQTQTRKGSEEANYVPDIVARSYEALNKIVPPPPAPEPQRESNYHTRPTTNQSQYNQSYDARSTPNQNWGNVPERRNSEERWPSPPPPMDNQRPMPKDGRYDQPQSSQHPTYSDDWRRPGPPQGNMGPAGYQQRSQGPPQPPDDVAPHDNRSTRPALILPPPPRQPYSNVSDDSSEGIDVDAPTPPPSNKQLQSQHLLENRSNSPYELNKPIPVRSGSGKSKGRQYQDRNMPPSSDQQPQSAIFDKHGRNFQQDPEEPQSPSDSRTSVPRKPQRNSVVQDDPQNQEEDEFTFEMGKKQKPLSHGASRERQRLGKSGTLANRKPPSRQGSTSNLLEVGNEDDFQIEVSDLDLTQRPSRIEVHREESMRILRAQNKKDSTSSSSDVPSSILERAKDEKKSQKEEAKRKDTSPTKSASSQRKVDSKLLFKIPATDVAKTSTAHPIPEIKESSSQAARRPPTYLGFGNTVEPTKQKTDLLGQFKKARENAMKSAVAKQDKALKSVSAFMNTKKEPKSPPKPKLTVAERNANVLQQMNVEIKPSEEHHRHKHDERNDVNRSSTRSNSAVKPEKYQDDDSANDSKYSKDRQGRGRDRQNEGGRAKSRGRSRSRERAISPEDRGRSRGRSRSRDRALSPDDRDPRTRGRSRSRERALSPEIRHKSRGRDYDERRYDDRRRYEEEPLHHRRSYSPPRHPHAGEGRYPAPHHPQPYHRHPTTREPDWVEQFRRGRERSSQPARRAWVNDPRRIEVKVGGSRRELDMDEFERDVRRATSYNSDFEQPPPRRQMIPSKLSGKGPPPPRKGQSHQDWMNALKEKNRSAERARPK